MQPSSALRNCTSALSCASNHIFLNRDISTYLESLGCIIKASSHFTIGVPGLAFNVPYLNKRGLVPISIVAYALETMPDPIDFINTYKFKDPYDQLFQWLLCKHRLKSIFRNFGENRKS